MLQELHGKREITVKEIIRRRTSLQFYSVTAAPALLREGVGRWALGVGRWALIQEREEPVAALKGAHN
jgi:hypothetical protein